MQHLSQIIFHFALFCDNTMTIKSTYRLSVIAHYIG